MNNKKRNIITDDISLIKGAMGLLDVSQKELSVITGISETSLSVGLKRHSAMKKENIDHIKSCLSNLGVEFVGNATVRLAEKRILTYSGHDGFRKFFDDIYDVAKTHHNPDICITNVNEAEYDKWLLDYEPIHNQRMTALDNPIKYKVLLKENDTHITSDTYCKYKWTPEELFSDVSLYIYGDKSAFIEFSDNNVVVTVVESETVTDSLRKMFQVTWKSAKQGLNNENT